MSMLRTVISWLRVKAGGEGETKCWKRPIMSAPPRRVLDHFPAHSCIFMLPAAASRSPYIRRVAVISDAIGTRSRAKQELKSDRRRDPFGSPQSLRVAALTRAALFTMLIGTGLLTAVRTKPISEDDREGMQ